MRQFAAPPVWRQPAPAPRWHAFQPMVGLCAWVRGLLYANAVAGLLSAALAGLVLAFPAEPVDPENLTHWEWGEGCMALINLLLLLTCAVMFIVFLFRARANVRALDERGLDQASFWVVAGWVVPIIWLWKPYQVVLELWERSACDSHGRAVSAASAGPPNAWWALWLISNGISAYSFRMDLRGEWDPDTLFPRLLQIGAALTWSWAGVVAARIVRDMTAAQHMRYAYLAAGEAEPLEGEPAGDSQD